MELIELGFCKKPHGIKGGFSFHLFSGEESVLDKGDKIYLFPFDDKSSLPKEGGQFSISSISFGNKTIVYLKEVGNRNQVEAMIPFTIKFPKEELPDAEEGRFYIEDLIGLKVLHAETKEELGLIHKCGDNTVQTILEIKGKLNTSLPLIENFFPEINIEEGYILINPPEVVG